MLPYLNNAQIEKLQAVMQHTLFDYEVIENENRDTSKKKNLVELFLSVLKCAIASFVAILPFVIATRPTVNLKLRKTVLSGTILTLL